MKAPEKIYMPNELLSEEWTRHIEGEDVEYTRTDSFIRKAAAYLNEKFYFNNLHYAVENNTFNCMEEMLEDFEKYMED